MELSAKENRSSIILTGIQYICLVLFLYLSPWIADSYWLIMELLGIFLGLYAIWVMRKSKLEITPVPKEHSTLIISGPYKHIRHPMYLAILMTFLPLLISHFEWNLLLVFILLFFNLIFKMRFEEKLLIRKFYDYRQYSEKTKYLIPFIY